MSVVSNVVFFVKKNAPQILFISGKAMEVTGVVWACYSSTKVKGKVEEAKAEMKEIKDKEESFEVTQNEAMKLKAKARGKFALEMAKLYGPPVLLMGAGGLCDLASHNILNKRVAGYAAAYASASAALVDYRNKVKDRFGEDLDNELMYNVTTKTFKEVTTDEDGNPHENEVVGQVAMLTGENPFAQIFDPTTSEYATGDVNTDMAFLSIRQNYLNDRLHSRHLLTKETMLDELGYSYEKDEKNIASDTLVLGWRYIKNNPIGDNYVDLRAKIVYLDNPDTGIPYKTILIDPNYYDIYKTYK